MPEVQPTHLQLITKYESHTQALPWKNMVQKGVHNNSICVCMQVLETVLYHNSSWK